MELNTNSGIYVKNYGWFIPSSDINALFLITDENETKYLGCFEGGKHSQCWNIISTFQKNEYLYFFSSYECIFWIYDLKHQILRKKRYADTYFGKINNVLLVGNVFCVFPTDIIGDVFLIDIKDCSVSTLNLSKFSSNKKQIVTPVHNDSDIFIVEYDCLNPKLIQLTAETKEIHTMMLDTFMKILSVSIYQNQLFIIGKDLMGNTLIATIAINQMKIINSNSIEFFDTFYKIDNNSKTYMNQKYIYFFSKIKKEILIFNYIDRTFDRIIEFDTLTDEQIGIGDFQSANQYIFLFSTNLGCVQELDLKKNRIIRKNIFINDEVYDYAKVLFLNQPTKHTFLETTGLGINSFLDDIEKDSIKDCDEKSNKSFGQQIFEHLLKY